MNDMSIVILVAIVLCGIVPWLLIPRRKSSTADVSSYHPNLMETLPTARHYAYFRQIRQALSAADSNYLMENASPQVAKQALQKRRAVARSFLKGLHEDFSNLTRLGRIIAALSPEVSRKQETERLMLAVKFQVLYTLVLLRLSTGNLPLEQLEYLTGLVGRLATRLDAAMTEVNALSAGQIPGRIGV
jgi:hypothetical protein